MDSFRSHLYSPQNDNWGFAPMNKGIQPEGKCPVCNSRFKWDNKKRQFLCPAHLTAPKRFTMYTFFKGERIWRGSTFEGEPLRTHYEAQKLVEKANAEKRAGKFDPTKWKLKKIEYKPGRLILKWYKEKYRAMKRGDLKPSYVVKLKSYIRLYFIPYGLKKDFDDIRNIKSCKDLFESMPQKLSLKYRSNIRMAIATFFNWCKNEEKLIDELPFIPRFPKQKYIPTVVNKEFRQFLVDNYIRPQHQNIFGFLIHQGCRPSEAIALKGDCLKDHPTLGKYVEYRRTLSEKIIVEIPKDSEARVNPIFEETMKYLPQTFADDFAFKNNGKLYTLTVLEKELMRALRLYNADQRKMAEEKCKVWEDIKIKLYEFCKHSWSTEMYEKGASLEDLQKYHGHSKPETSLLYTKIDVLKRFKKFAEVIPIKKEVKESGGSQ